MSGDPAQVEVALETSSAHPSVAVRRGDRFEELQLGGDRPHACDLLPGLQSLLERVGVGPDAIGSVIVGTGPGSYTGLRVGVATALGLARGSGAELFGVPSLEALAFGELRPGEGAAFLLDARQGELYLARYRREPERVLTLLAPCVTTAASLGQLLAEDERIFADDAALRAAGLEELRSRDPGRCAQAWPRAGALLRLGAARLASEGSHLPEDVEPLYLRAFAARNRRR